MQWLTGEIPSDAPHPLNVYEAPEAVIPHHPGAYAWLGPLLPPVAAGAGFAAAVNYMARQLSVAASPVPGAAIPSDRASWFLAVGTAIIIVTTTAITTLGPKLIDLLVQAKVKLAAAEAGTAQAEVERLKAQLEEARRELAEIKARHVGAVAELSEQRRSNQMLAETYHTLLESHRIAVSANARVATQAAADAHSLASAPVKVEIAPTSAPVPVREVDAGPGGTNAG